MGRFSSHFDLSDLGGTLCLVQELTLTCLRLLCQECQQRAGHGTGSPTRHTSLPFQATAPRLPVTTSKHSRIALNLVQP
jgi:hypothetical protein